MRYGHKDRLADVNKERYDNSGLFDYFFRCVEKFMPWIRNIYLIVSNPEQVPEAAHQCKKVHVVLHSDFMPAKFLPTFNSTTIEMFLPNIQGLSEHFIYANDDIFPIGPLFPEDFFAEDGRIRINLRACSIDHHMTDQFRRVCLNNHVHVAAVTGYKFDGHTYLRPVHSFTPMIKSHCRECLDKLGPSILTTASAFRTSAQHNQYIYPLYECFTRTVASSPIEFIYTSLKLGGQGIANIINTGHYRVICINDVQIPNRRSFHFDIIKQAFEDILAK